MIKLVLKILSQFFGTDRVRSKRGVKSQKPTFGKSEKTDYLYNSKICKWRSKILMAYAVS